MSDQNPEKISLARDHLANERTFLAWIRTSIGLMAFGFVVEKFSIFIKKLNFFLAKEDPNAAHFVSTHTQSTTSTFGILLVAFGALICLLAFIKFKKIEKQLTTNTYSPTILLNIMLMLFVIVIGISLTIFLVHSI